MDIMLVLWVRQTLLKQPEQQAAFIDNRLVKRFHIYR